MANQKLRKRKNQPLSIIRGINHSQFRQKKLIQEIIKKWKHRIRKYKFTLITLSVLVCIGFSLRLHGINIPHQYSFDEGLYVDLATQLNHNFLNYNAIQLYEEYRKQQPNRNFPEYLKWPLFQHPPLYPFLVAISESLLYDLSPMVRAGLVSTVFGTLTLLVIFFLGCAIYDHRVGLLATAYLVLDPVHWMCSQKIWIDSTLTFFVTLTVLLFVFGLSNLKWLYLSGISTGLALQCKYPGGLVIPAIITFALLFRRDLFVRREFWKSGLISVLIFLPWILWNIIVYTSNEGKAGQDFVRNLIIQGKFLTRYGPLLLLLFGIVFLIRRTPHYFGKISFIKTHLRSKIISRQQLSRISLAIVATGCVIAILLKSQSLITVVLDILNPNYVPSHGWDYTIYKSQEGKMFFFSRLVNFSPAYLFCFVSPFLFKKKEEYFLLVLPFWFLIFFLGLPYYESRYVLPYYPALLVMSSGFQIRLINKIRLIKNKFLRAGLLICFGGLLIYFFTKLIIIDLKFPFPNQTAIF